MSRYVKCPHCKKIFEISEDPLQEEKCPDCNAIYPQDKKNIKMTYKKAQTRFASWGLAIVVSFGYLYFHWTKHRLEKQQQFIQKIEQTPLVTLQETPHGQIIHLSKKNDLALSKIKAGSFIMGSPQTEEGRSMDEIQHQVILTHDFWLGKNEVTQKQYQAVMDNNPSYFKGEDLPVERVSWHEAMVFCQKLNQLTEGLRPKGYTYTLPTEAQWEYACRAGRLKPHQSQNLNEVAWYSYNSNRETHPVGQKLPNAWGLYDMHGNVWEWCFDEYDIYSTTMVSDHQGKESGSLRVKRGGSWCNEAQDGCFIVRGSADSREQLCDVGFRVALSKTQE